MPRIKNATPESDFELKQHNDQVYLGSEKSVVTPPEKRNQSLISNEEEKARVEASTKKSKQPHNKETNALTVTPTQEIIIPSKDLDPEAFYIVKAISLVKKPEHQNKKVVFVPSDLHDTGVTLPSAATSARAFIAVINPKLEPYKIHLSEINSKLEKPQISIDEKVFHTIKETLDNSQSTTKSEIVTENISQARVVFNSPPSYKSTPKQFIIDLNKTSYVFTTMGLTSSDKFIVTDLLSFEQAIKEILGADFASKITQQGGTEQHASPLSDHPLFLLLIQSLESINVTIKSHTEQKPTTYNLLNSCREALTHGLIKHEDISLIDALKQIKKYSTTPKHREITSDSQNVNSLIEIMKLVPNKESLTTEKIRGVEKVVFTVSLLKETAVKNSIKFPYPNCNSEVTIVKKANKDFGKDKMKLFRYRKEGESISTPDLWISKHNLDAFKVTKPSLRQLNHPLVQAIIGLAQNATYQYNPDNNKVFFSIDALKNANPQAIKNSHYYDITTAVNFIKEVKKDKSLTGVKFHRSEPDGPGILYMNREDFENIAGSETQHNKLSKEETSSPEGSPPHKDLPPPVQNLTQKDSNAIQIQENKAPAPPILITSENFKEVQNIGMENTTPRTKQPIIYQSNSPSSILQSHANEIRVTFKIPEKYGLSAEDFVRNLHEEDSFTTKGLQIETTYHKFGQLAFKAAVINNLITFLTNKLTQGLVDVTSYAKHDNTRILINFEDIKRKVTNLPRAMLESQDDFVSIANTFLKPTGITINVDKENNSQIYVNNNEIFVSLKQQQQQNFTLTRNILTKHSNEARATFKIPQEYGYTTQAFTHNLFTNYRSLPGIAIKYRNINHEIETSFQSISHIMNAIKPNQNKTCTYQPPQHPQPPQQNQIQHPQQQTPQYPLPPQQRQIQYPQRQIPQHPLPPQQRQIQYPQRQIPQHPLPTQQRQIQYPQRQTPQYPQPPQQNQPQYTQQQTPQYPQPTQQYQLQRPQQQTPQYPQPPQQRQIQYPQRQIPQYPQPPQQRQIHHPQQQTPQYLQQQNPAKETSSKVNEDEGKPTGNSVEKASINDKQQAHSKSPY